MHPKKKIFEKTGLCILKLYKLLKIFFILHRSKLIYSKIPGKDIKKIEKSNEMFSPQKFLKILKKLIEIKKLQKFYYN